VLRQTVFGILFNCSTPEAITRAFQQIRNDPALTQRLVASKIRLGAYANRLTPVASDWTMEGSNGPQPFRDDVAPQQYYDDFVHEWVHELKTSIVGGCCGITPDHIALISSKLHPGGSK
jgi:S-methylmethionine-dependent homocysteine/selenocysteine methylase